MAATDPAGNPAPPGGFKTGGWYGGYQYWDGSFAPVAGQIHPSSKQVGDGQDVSQEVMRASSVAAGLAPEAYETYIASERAKGLSSAGDVTPYLNNFQQGLFSGLEAPALKVPTMEEIRAKVEPAGGAPEPFSRVEKFGELREEYGVASLEEQLNTLKAQEKETQAVLRQRKAAEEGKPVAMGVIEGRISEVERQERENLDFIQRQINYVIDELNTKYSVINTYMNLMNLDYQDAVDRYESEFTRNLQLFDIIRGYEREALDEYHRQQDNARANLQIYANAVMGGNISYAGLGADQKLMISKLEAQSGMPIGFISSLGMSASDRLITFNSDTGEALMTDSSGNLNVVQTGMRSSSSGGGGTVSERTASRLRGAFDEMSSWLSQQGGEDKYVSPDEWNYARSLWVQQGYNASDFDSAFKNIHVGIPEDRGWASEQFGFESPY